MTTDLSPEEREAFKIAMREEINAAFERGTSGGPERVFEAGWLAAREYSKQREEKLREALRIARRRIRQVHELADVVRGRRLREITTDAICEIDDALAENGETDD